VEAAPGTRLEQVARAVGVTAREITSLNPHLRRGHVPTNRSYAIRLPPGTGQAFSAVAATEQGRATLARAPEASGGASHTVRRGESLSVIARSHGVSVSALRSENSLRGDRIVAGSTLQIPAR
jgi:membrane-bound lytic murein transglycosylase D